MKLAIALGVLMLPLVVGVSFAHTTTCTPEQAARGISLVAGDGSLGSIWWVDYANDGDLSGDDWLYAESGVVAGSVQTGADHVVLGANWGHDHRCREPVAGNRDHELY